LRSAAADDFPAILQQLQRTTPSSQRDRELAQLFEAWGRRDSARALATATKIPDKNSRDLMISAVVSGWILQEPEAAFDWTLTQPEGAQFAAEAMARLAKDDPQLALRLVTNAPKQIDPAFTEQIYNAIIRSPVEQGRYEDAKNIIDSVGDRLLRKQLMVDLASTWGRYQPQQAAEWLVAQPEGNDREDAIGNLAYAWAQTDAVAAANFASTLPSGPSRRQALVNAVVVWAEHDIVAASDWLDRFDPQPDNDAAVATIATSHKVVNQNPDVALSWAESIINPEQRVDAIRQIAQQWGQKNQAAAQQYVQSTPLLTTQQRTELLEILSSTSSAGSE
jgi:hypothetical protein